MTLDLPEPPSVNRMWRRVGSRTVLSKAGRDYKAAVAIIARQQMKAQGAITIRKRPVVLEMVWRRSRRIGDTSNRIKCVEDALNGVAYEDDAQVVELHLYRVDDKANPGATVTIREAA